MGNRYRLGHRQRYRPERSANGEQRGEVIRPEERLLRGYAVVHGIQEDAGRHRQVERSDPAVHGQA